MATKANAGSFKKGEKRPWQGRPKGAITKRSEQLAAALGEQGYDPQSLVRLGFEIARDEATRAGERIQAIAAVLPYMLPKLSAIEVSGGEGGAPVRIRIVRGRPPEPEDKS